MSRTLRQIIKDSNRSGSELGLVLMEKLRNQIQGDDLIVTDKEIALMSKELIPEELGMFSFYETIHNTILNIYNFSRQTTFKFYASYNALVTMQDKAMILEYVNTIEGTPAKVRDAVGKVCSDIKSLKGKTKDTYAMMFDAITFIEASNTYIKLLLSHFSITGLNCMQFNTDEFYSLLGKLNSQTQKVYAAMGSERVGEAKAVFMDIGEPDKKAFTPDPRKISEFKEFLRNEPNRVIKNSFSFIMLLQNKKEVF